MRPQRPAGARAVSARHLRSNWNRASSAGDRSLATALLLYLLVTRTRMGMQVRAGASNRDMALAMGTNVQRLFTAVFALARTVGWIAQLNEMIGDPEYKIGRPRQLFTGSVRRDVLPIGQR